MGSFKVSIIKCKNNKKYSITKNIILPLPCRVLFSNKVITIFFISLLFLLSLSIWLKTFYCTFVGYVISTLFNTLLFFNLFIYSLLLFCQQSVHFLLNS